MRRLMAVVGGLAALGIVASMTLASASQDGGIERPWRDGIFSAAEKRASEGNQDCDQTFALMERNPTETEIDNPPEGFSQGDEVAFGSDLFRNQQKVGTLDGHVVITFVSQQQVRALVTFTATLRGNEISATGVAEFTEETGELEFSITGGTGRFNDVGGEVTVFENDTVELVFCLKHLE